MLSLRSYRFRSAIFSFIKREFSSKMQNVLQLSPRVVRILGCNPGPRTLEGTNSYLIGTGKRRFLLDTTQRGKKEYISLLKDFLTEKEIELEKILITHWHHDHVGAVSEVLEDVQGGVQVQKYPFPSGQEEKSEMEASVSYLKDGDTLSVEGATLKVIFTPGHTEDHMALLLSEENAIFSGDCMLGRGTAIFEDLYTYMNSLNLMLALNPTLIYPGHGPVIENAVTRINEYIQHRQKREQQILTVLEEHKNEKLTAMELVEIIYSDAPKGLYMAAAGNVTHHLTKLIKDNKVKIFPDPDEEHQYQIISS